MALMLQQMAEALVKTADLIEEADRGAAGFFELGQIKIGSGKPPGLASPASQGNDPPPAERPDLNEEFDEFKASREDYTAIYVGYPRSGIPRFLAQLAGFHRRDITDQETDVLDELGLWELFEMNDIHDEAFETEAAVFGEPGNNDGIPDAFRHAYWSARLTQAFGADWARRFTDAHENRTGNQAARDFMDRWNNDLGIRIAEQNPDATPDELSQLIVETINNGEGVYIPDAAQHLIGSKERDRVAEDGPLAYTDQ